MDDPVGRLGGHHPRVGTAFAVCHLVCHGHNTLLGAAGQQHFAGRTRLIAFARREQTELLESEDSQCLGGGVLRVFLLPNRVLIDFLNFA